MRRLTRLTMLAAMLTMMAAMLPTAFTPQASAHPNINQRAHLNNDCGYGESNHCGAWATNGCTVVPDRVWGVFNFNHPCDHHDGCYGGHWYWRSGCDAIFWYDMESSCTQQWSWWHPSRALCRGVRDTYYSGVRALGYHAYNGWSISGPSGW